MTTPRSAIPLLLGQLTVAAVGYALAWLGSGVVLVAVLSVGQSTAARAEGFAFGGGILTLFLPIALCGVVLGGGLAWRRVLALPVRRLLLGSAIAAELSLGLLVALMHSPVPMEASPTVLAVGAAVIVVGLVRWGAS